jgi:hypothetical protein
MRFMMMVKAGAESEAGLPPRPELMAAVEKLSQEATRAGILLASEGLQPTSKGALVKVSGGKLRVLDGPFAETKEVIGGYAILRASSREEAIRLGKEFMQVHADVLGDSYEGALEIREML